MLRYMTTAFICLAVSYPCVSAAEVYSTAYDKCTERAEGITSNLNDCNNEEIKKQDVRLNLSYKAAMAVLPAEKKIQLRDAQRLWIKYRDANCGMYYSFSGGTMDMLNGAGCELSMTKERADTLEWFVENGGD